MRQYISELKNFFRKGDMILLLLCLITTTFGVILIASTTNYMGNLRYIIIQIVAAGIGVGLYALISSIDLSVLSEHRLGLMLFNCFMLALLIPFGTDNHTGNRSWLDIPLVPVDIQPAEVCKITFIVIIASTMASHKSAVSNWRSVFHMVWHLGILCGINMALSSDAGVTLIFVFIFIGMAFAGGVSLIWYLIALGGIVAIAPFAWDHLLGNHQKLRLEMLWNPNLDPDGVSIRYHSVRSLRSLTGGGWSGQGLFHGIRTQNGELFAQHTDFIFAAVGEELGFLGCLFVLLLQLMIILRCVQVGIRSQDYMRRMVCFGAASALIFQVTSNIGMCIGMTPVIGLTLPFVSYGGSSIVSLFAMLGLVSGVHARPEAPSHALYIRPYR